VSQISCSRPWYEIAFQKECAGEAGGTIRSTSGILKGVGGHGKFQTPIGPCSGQLQSWISIKRDSETMQVSVAAFCQIGRMTKKLLIDGAVLLHSEDFKNTPFVKGLHFMGNGRVHHVGRVSEHHRQQKYEVSEWHYWNFFESKIVSESV
jgi:hypothetical protein